MNLPNPKLFFATFVIRLGVLLLFCNPEVRAQELQLKNNNIRINFDRESGALVSIRDMVQSQDLLDINGATGSPWEVFFHSQNGKKIDINAAETFSFSKPDSSTLILSWQEFSGIENEDLRVTAKIILSEDKPLSKWGISLEGSKGMEIEKVVFPKVKGIKDFGNEELAVPVWMGQIMKNPRRYLQSLQEKEKRVAWSYPGSLSMQFTALYDAEKIGFYTAANDSLSYRKSFSFSLDSLNNLSYEMTNYPSLDSTLNSYSPPYQSIIGTLKGDWITAAQRYREWGSKQKWSKESRLKMGLTPSWLENTALWVWNREESAKVLKPALDLKKRLGLPVSVLWHWWHEGAYDVSFPEYFPPREGKKSFMWAVSEAREQGVNALIYMNQLQWGTSTKSFENENASRYAVKDINGDMISHAYNIFTGQSLTNMCIATAFWKDKYAALAEKAVNAYGVSGIYMDQACLSRMCYDENHGHTIGGGNYWAENSKGLTEEIRSGISQNNQLVLAGEGGLESYLSNLDVFLTLQVSRERYAGVSDWKTIPLFQAVYHQYGITFGSYSSLLSPPYDDKWPEKYAPENELSLLDEDFNRQFLMEQARSFVWGMQPMIANYKPLLASKRKAEIEYLKQLVTVRQQGLKYLLHGAFVRTPPIAFPEEQLKISRLSIYAGRGEERVTTSGGRFPVIYSGSWKAADNQMAIALASISNKPFKIDFSFKADGYGLSSSGEIFIIDADRKRHLASYSGGTIDINFTLPSKGLYLVEIIPDR
jgi:hypothetical protein